MKTQPCTNLYCEPLCGVDDEGDDVDSHQTQCHQRHGNQEQEAEGVEEVAFPWRRMHLLLCESIEIVLSRNYILLIISL